MSQTETPIVREGPGGRRDVVPDDQGGVVAPSNAGRRTHKPQWPSLIWSSVVCLIAALMLVGGAWVLWMDRIDRDGPGFVQIESGQMHADTYAIVSDVRGDGPDWLYGSTVFGDARARVTSDTNRPVFVGVARARDVAKYLDGVAYATVDHLPSGTMTPHLGDAPSALPSDAAIWATKQQGKGEQTIVWTPRNGDWRIVIMNADASRGIAVHDDVGAEFPLAPRVALGLLVGGGLLATLGIWLLVRAIRRGRVAVIDS